MLQHSLVSPAPDRREAPVTGHDGAFWPLVRSAMNVAGLIRLRMAEDLFAPLQAQGEDAVISERDLVRLGWLPEQIARHGAGAMEIARMRLERQAMLAARRA